MSRASGPPPGRSATGVGWGARHAEWTRALHAEWTKARTLMSTAWLLLGAVGAMVATSAALVEASRYQSSVGQDLPKLSLTGVDLGQAVVAILAVQMIGNEFDTGMVRVTLVALPRRLGVIGAKAAALVVLVAVAGGLAVGACLGLGRLALPGKGFTASHGYALVSLAQGATARAAGGTVLYLVLVALLALGVATAVRDTALGAGIVLGLLYLFPLLAHVVSDPAWSRRLEQIGPMTAGLAIQATSNRQGMPLSPWAGLGVLAAWAAAALLCGGVLLCRRDA